MLGALCASVTHALRTVVYLEQTDPPQAAHDQGPEERRELAQFATKYPESSPEHCTRTCSHAHSVSRPIGAKTTSSSRSGRCFRRDSTDLSSVEFKRTACEPTHAEVGGQMQRPGLRVPPKPKTFKPNAAY